MTRNEAKRSVAKIREKFPFPMSQDDTLDASICYCVGGAYLAFKGVLPDFSWQMFPSQDELADALCAETNKYWDVCYKHATEIVSYNDSGKFEEAWAELERALS